ncbi:translation initiation factor IF-2 [Cydia fagiglandana]|uniref:translation initiation factor IF-2 n=1 Tax=Cydia fagiglandana TaxID=1458189 RepID=UPI002FEE18D0
MPSAANPKSEKPASSEATDNTPVRQVLTIIEHKIRNLEKRKSKLTSYRDLQKSGKELNADQKIAVAKYDEVAQTLEFARDLSKQITSIAVSTEKEAKKQAKRETWIRYAADTNKIREVLLILDCLTQMGNAEARDDFLNGTNGAAKLTEEDLKILDDLYPEVTPKHEANEEGQPGFPAHTTKAAEHIYAIIDGKPKEILGTTYAHIKEIIMTVHSCGYFDKVSDDSVAPSPGAEVAPEAEAEPAAEPAEPAPAPLAYPAPLEPHALPAAYPLRPLPPITLQEVEHAYFAQQYPQQRPIAEVIGSQNFFFLQESEIDSPVGTPQPPPMNPPSPPGPIPTQTFTNQHFVPMQEPGPLPMPPPHFQAPYVPLAAPLPPPPQPPAGAEPAQQPPPERAEPAERQPSPDADEWREPRSPEREDGAERKTQGQGDGQGRFRRYRGGGGRGAPNGYRGRGGYRPHDGYQGRHAEYQPRAGKDGPPRQYNDNYQSRPKDGYRGRDGYYGNGDAGEHPQHENGQSYGGGFKSRGRGGRGARAAPRPPRARAAGAAHAHSRDQPDQ